MEEHLGAWAPLLCEQMRNFAKTDFYRGLASLAQGFLETDTALMNDLLSEAA
jgi:TorA maturation chaperone TorD